ncbi:MAG: type II toxin-antitoxin system YoeB family toxin [Mycobacterium sp.]|nr:type II toxin-antitoxin system YoeB family toxin [Mycobacterium sp.]
MGKPAPLKGDLSGYWSWRIDDEHRLVYRADLSRNACQDSCS